MAGDGPFDGIRCAVLVQVPDEFGKLRAVLVPFVPEGLEVVVVPELEGGLSDADVGHSFVWGYDLRVVDEIGCKAIPLEWTEVLVPAVARFPVRFLDIFHGLRVVIFDDAADIRHTTVTYF